MPTRPTSSSDVHIALLRGINVGGKNKLAMATLREFFTNAGAQDVSTYIQSGNVLLRTSPKLAKQLGSHVSAAIESHLGLQVPVVMRSRAELEHAANHNPFVAEQIDPSTLYVAFLADKPSAARSALLDPQHSAPDSFVLRGREIFMHCPNGMARSKLTNAYWDNKLSTTSTVRNWNTVLKLVELCANR